MIDPSDTIDFTPHMGTELLDVTLLSDRPVCQ